MDKSRIAVISVVSGSVTSKQIEVELMNKFGKTIWQWKARPVGEGKFLMKFPNENMITDVGYFRPLGMRTVDAQIIVDPWTPAVEAIGMLQRGWFRIKGIPTDQRSIRTIAKVGGLVGKVTEIDEKTRYNQEYVRARIACRSVAQVPATAEGTLGLYIYNFHFEREVLVEDAENPDMHSIWVKKQDDIHQQKKPRFEDNKIGSAVKSGGRSQQNYQSGNTEKFKTQYDAKRKGMEIDGTVKEGNMKEEGKKEKLMSDAQRSATFAFIPPEGSEERVHLTDSDSDSDDGITKGHFRFNDQGQSSSNPEGNMVQHLKQQDDQINEEKHQNLTHNGENQKGRRVSERLKKDTGLTVKERNKRMALKRNLEAHDEKKSLSKSELQDMIKEGARMLIQAAGAVPTERTSSAPRMLKSKEDED
ncbi:hypothetical protein U9M48_027315 [Paspalum notatum var. saurae]|uniref:DUF4283 domain-containing protein n=1 Tax=Paspalum notatum var. saurae TaxID=547442 RepID=A0AAQ3TYL5_PASNO